uniref:Uncharacterized protein n=1 Tax=Acrobeloides nanus TaxID=290746 RepID=A0A914DQG7_9BILA
MLYYFLICLSFLIILNNGAVIKVELNRRILKNNQLNRIERPRNKRSSFGTEDRKMVQLGNQFFGNINDMMYTAKIGIGTPGKF